MPTDKTPLYDSLHMGRSSIDLYANEVGAAFVDIQSFAAYVGGSPTNISVGARRLGLKTALLTGLGDDPVGRIVGDSPFRMLNRHAISHMAASRLIDFGAHSHTHPSLGRISSQECSDEIKRSVAITQQLSGRPCALFAYPFGYRQDYTAEAISCLQMQGVQVAVTGIPEPNDQRTPLMELRRYGVGADESIAVFQMKVHHLMTHVMRLSR